MLRMGCCCLAWSPHFSLTCMTVTPGRTAGSRGKGVLVRSFPVTAVTMKSLQTKRKCQPRCFLTPKNPLTENQNPIHAFSGSAKPTQFHIFSSQFLVGLYWILLNFSPRISSVHPIVPKSTLHCFNYLSLKKTEFTVTYLQDCRRR